MQPITGVSTEKWKHAAKALHETSSRSCVDFLNGQGLRVASNAIKFTQKASRVEIEHMLGVKSSTIKRRKGEAGAKGWVRITNRVLKENSYAERIVIARFRKLGKWGIKGKTVAEKAINLIAAKVRSVAFIKSGWIPSVRTLSGIVYKKPKMENAAVALTKVGADKGYAIPAKIGRRIAICTIVNTALNAVRFSTWHGKPGNPMPIARRGLQAALDFSEKDMTDKLAERLRGDLRGFGVR